MQRTFSLLMAGLCAVALALPALPAQAAKRAEHLVYSGQLRDESGAALGGIYPLTFSLHRDGSTQKKLWFEQHWVAVEDGVYTVELGHDRPLPRGLDVPSAFLGVALTGGGELMRERLSERNLPGGDGVIQPEEAGTRPPPSRTAPGAPGGTVDYADKAGLAFEAEHASTADRIGNLSLEQLDARYKKAGGARIGTAQRTTGAIGGEGGRPYRLVCPKGYVAIGIQGGAGKLVDSMEVICAPIE